MRQTNLASMDSALSDGVGPSNMANSKESQISGRHGGTEGAFPSHPDDHSLLDDILVSSNFISYFFIILAGILSIIFFPRFINS